MLLNLLQKTRSVCLFCVCLTVRSFVGAIASVYVWLYLATDSTWLKLRKIQFLNCCFKSFISVIYLYSAHFSTGYLLTYTWYTLFYRVSIYLYSTHFSPGYLFTYTAHTFLQGIYLLIVVNSELYLV